MYSVNAQDDNEIHSGSDVSLVAADGTTLSSTSSQDDSTEFRGHFIYLEYHLYPNARMEMVLQNVLIKLCLGAKQRWCMKIRKTGMTTLKQFSWATVHLPSFNKVFFIFFAVLKGDAPFH